MSTGRPLERLRARLPRPASWDPPRPQVGVELAMHVPAGALRLAASVGAVGCTALVATTEAHWVVAGALIVAMVLRPAGPASTLFVVGAGLLVLSSGTGAIGPRILVLVLGVHLVVHLTAFVGDLPVGAAVELRALAGEVRSFLAVQAIAQTIALLAAWLTSRALVSLWLPTLAGIGLAALSWGILRRLDPRG